MGKLIKSKGFGLIDLEKDETFSDLDNYAKAIGEDVSELGTAVQTAGKNITVSLETNAGGDPIIKTEYQTVAGDTLSASVAFDKEDFEVNNEHIKAKEITLAQLMQNRTIYYLDFADYTIYVDTAKTREPTAKEFYSAYHNNGVKFLDVNADDEESKEYTPIEIEVHRSYAEISFAEYNDARTALIFANFSL